MCDFRQKALASGAGFEDLIGQAGDRISDENSELRREARFRAEMNTQAALMGQHKRAFFNAINRSRVQRVEANQLS